MQIEVKARVRQIEFGISAGRPRFVCRRIQNTKVGRIAAVTQRRTMFNVPKRSPAECVLVALRDRDVSRHA